MPTGAGLLTDVADRAIVLDVVGLQESHVEAGLTPRLEQYVASDSVSSLTPAMPAVTIPAQTTLASGRRPDRHGDVANGKYDRSSDNVAFWERERETRRRLWEVVTEDTPLTTGVLFFQHQIGTTADIAVTPAPIEDENNNLIAMNCWTRPESFYESLREDFGHFPLHNYWGPAANLDSSRWILAAAREAIDRFDPDLLWIYVPYLDYPGMREGPSSDTFENAVTTIDEEIGSFLEWLSTQPRWEETAIVTMSEYGFHDVSKPIFPNIALRDAGLLQTTSLADEGSDIDLAASTAFAMVDHQIAHVYTDEPERAKAVLAPLEGIDEVLEGTSKQAAGLGHVDSGELVLLADADAWFQYYWWRDSKDAPPYAASTDIHAKPGFDPCELFLGDSGMVSLDPSKVSGSHGRVDSDASGVIGFGGPAISDEVSITSPVNATAVAPTIASVLGVQDDLSMTFKTDPINPEESG